MTSTLTELRAWSQLDPPVRIGLAEHGTLTLHQLTRAGGYQRVTAAMAQFELGRRSLQLSPLHLANWAIMKLLARPVFFDGVWIAADAHQLGFVIDRHGETPELWLAPELLAGPCPDPSAIGTAIGGLLGPIADTDIRQSRIHERAVTTIATESAIAGLYRTARTGGRPDDAEWLEEASAAVSRALGAQVTSERLRCRPDDGPAVVVPSRSLCCVLNAKISCHSCPGCPNTGDQAAQTRDVSARIATMADDEFLDITGRRRQGRLPARG